MINIIKYQTNLLFNRSAILENNKFNRQGYIAIAITISQP
jgi:hypothetical protein